MELQQARCCRTKAGGGESGKAPSTIDSRRQSLRVRCVPIGRTRLCYCCSRHAILVFDDAIAKAHHEAYPDCLPCRYRHGPDGGKTTTIHPGSVSSESKISRRPNGAVVQLLATHLQFSKAGQQPRLEPFPCQISWKSRYGAADQGLIQQMEPYDEMVFEDEPPDDVGQEHGSGPGDLGIE